jgi:hypothetical protein
MPVAFGTRDHDEPTMGVSGHGRGQSVEGGLCSTGREMFIGDRCRVAVPPIADAALSTCQQTGDDHILGHTLIEEVESPPPEYRSPQSPDRSALPQVSGDSTAGSKGSLRNAAIRSAGTAGEKR